MAMAIADGVFFWYENEYKHAMNCLLGSVGRESMAAKQMISVEKERPPYGMAQCCMYVSVGFEEAIDQYRHRHWHDQIACEKLFDHNYAFHTKIHSITPHFLNYMEGARTLVEHTNVNGKKWTPNYIDCNLCLDLKQLSYCFFPFSCELDLVEVTPERSRWFSIAGC